MSNISWFHDKKRSKFTFRHHFCSCSFWWRTSHADNSLTLCFSVNICFLKKKWMKPSGCDAVAAACSPELVRGWKHHFVNYLLLVWFVLLHVSAPLFDTKLSHFQNSGDSLHGRWNIQWCLGFSSSPAWILRLLLGRPLGAPPAGPAAPSAEFGPRQ